MAALVAVLVVGFALTTEQASADEPFLCPIVGDGVMHADSVNGNNGVADIHPDAGTPLLPTGGANQAGANADSNSYNTTGPVEGAGPGGNPDFSPIWAG